MTGNRGAELMITFGSIATSTAAAAAATAAAAAAAAAAATLVDHRAADSVAAITSVLNTNQTSLQDLLHKG